MKKIKFFIIFISIFITVFFIIKYFFYSPDRSKKSKASSPVINLSFDPVNPQLQVGKDFSTSVKIKSNENLLLRGYSLKITFNKNSLDLKKIDFKTGSPSAGLTDDNNNLNQINNQGIIDIIGEFHSATGENLKKDNFLELVNLTFEYKTQGETGLKIDKNQAKFYLISVQTGQLKELVANNDAFFGQGNINITPNTTVVGNVILDLKLKVQGINSRPSDPQMYFNVKLLNENNRQEYQSSGGIFISDDKGIFNGRVGFQIPSIGGRWLVYVKGQYHIQKKICDPNPSEGQPGIYRCSQGNISLKEGYNSFDFSGITLLAGDLDSNGIVDAFDYGLVKNNLGKKDSDTLKKADINRDGIVDTQDFSLILYALSIKTDEM